MFALTLQGGQCVSSAPDVCQTPAAAGAPVPVPYVNIFQCSMIMPATACTKVFIAGAPALNVGSQSCISNGDEAGVQGGVVSGRFIGPGAFVQGSLKVQLQGKPAVSQGATTKHNGGNTLGQCVMAGQSKVEVA